MFSGYCAVMPPSHASGGQSLKSGQQMPSTAQRNTAQSSYRSVAPRTSARSTGSAA